MKSTLTFVAIVFLSVIASVAFFGNWGVFFIILREYPVARALFGLAIGLLAATAWFALGRAGYLARFSSIRLTVPGLGDIEIGLTQHEREVLWRLFIELATRVTVQPLQAQEGSLTDAMSSLHDFFGVAREQLAQAPIRDAAKGRDTAQVLILHVLNAELRPFLARWRPRLATALAAGASESTWPETPACRAALDATRLRVLDLVWQLGDQLGVVHLEAILPQRTTAPAVARASVAQAASSPVA